MLHNASLLIDDIQDNSKLRRGSPVAHSIYGVPLTINAANYVYFLAMEKALTLKHADVTKIFVGMISLLLFRRRRDAREERPSYRSRCVNTR